jgi:ribosome-binding protein aMBF1 (putative translation factor)
MVRKKTPNFHGQQSVAGSRAGQASGSARSSVHEVLTLELRRLLAEQGVSKEELARRIGEPVTYVDDILSGRRKDVGIGEAEGIANALGVEDTVLVKRRD